MEMLSLEKELKENSYPGRGIVIGRSADGKKAVTAYFIMGRSENSRNRVLELLLSSTIAGEGRKVLWHVICMIMNGMFRKRQEWK